MIAVRLVRLIEAHSDELADGLLTKFQTSSRTRDLRNVPAQELRERSLEVMRHLSEWLVCKSDSDIERRYREMGFTRSVQKVSFADFCWAMVLTKEQIWDFIQREGFLGGPLEIYGAMELLRMLDQFFERAICFGAEGYESAKIGMVDCVHVSRQPSPTTKSIVS
jgi:hypothetical protein